MNEIEKIIDYYNDENSLGSVALEFEGKILDEPAAMQYLEKYYLPYNEYTTRWKPVQDKIFRSSEIYLPEMMFREAYKICAITGGYVFDQHSFEIAKNLAKSVEDKYLFVIPNDEYNAFCDKPWIRLKFPVDISWDELNSGNIISAHVFDVDTDEYYVFSESALWGKYSANDYIHPMDIYGVVEDVVDVFKEIFVKHKDNELAMITDELPTQYQNRYLEL